MNIGDLVRTNEPVEEGYIIGLSPDGKIADVEYINSKQIIKIEISNLIPLLTTEDDELISVLRDSWYVAVCNQQSPKSLDIRIKKAMESIFKKSKKVN